MTILCDAAKKPFEAAAHDNYGTWSIDFNVPFIIDPMRAFNLVK